MEYTNLSLGLQLLIVAVVILELIFKGIALWHAARKSQKGWFVSLLLINTAGIFPIIYLLRNREKK